MAQIKTFSWTNPASAVPYYLDCGFQPAKVTIIDTTNGDGWIWQLGMSDNTAIQISDGSLVGTGGVAPFDTGAVFGATVTGITNANPGVITVTDAASYDWIAAGNEIYVVQCADDQSGSTLNQKYTIASVSGDSVTTTRNTSSDSVYVSGGLALQDPADGLVATRTVVNEGFLGLRLRTNVVGGNSASMVAIVEGQNPVT